MPRSCPSIFQRPWRTISIATAVVVGAAWAVAAAFAPDEPAAIATVAAAPAAEPAGLMPAAAAPAAASLAQASPAPALRLAGVVLGAGRHGSQALIADGHRSAIFREGDALSASRRLMRIESDRVVVDDPLRGSTTLQLDTGGETVAAAPAVPLPPPTTVVAATERAPRTPSLDANGYAPEPAADAN